MGQHWQNRLTTMEGQEGQVILRQTLTENTDTGNNTHLETDEEQHCLRMRRCGAVVLWSKIDVIRRQTPYYGIPPQPAERQVFGWPQAGGVWVLRKPSTVEGLTLEEAYEVLMNDTKGEEHEAYRNAVAELRNATDMNAVCEVVKNAGGQFFSMVTDCPEVQTLGL